MYDNIFCIKLLSFGSGWDAKDGYNHRILEHTTKYPNKKHTEYYQWFKNKHNQGNHLALRSVPSKQTVPPQQRKPRQKSIKRCYHSVRLKPFL